MTYKSHIIKALLRDTRDKVVYFEMSGIYEIKCDDCNKKYFGQIIRFITCFWENVVHLRYERSQTSGDAHHELENNHSVNERSLRLEKTVNVMTV